MLTYLQIFRIILHFNELLFVDFKRTRLLSKIFFKIITMMFCLLVRSRLLPLKELGWPRKYFQKIITVLCQNNVLFVSKFGIFLLP